MIVFEHCYAACIERLFLCRLNAMIVLCSSNFTLIFSFANCSLHMILKKPFVAFNVSCSLRANSQLLTVNQRVRRSQS